MKLAEARAHWHSTQAKFKKATPTRIAYLGDGKGTERGNLFVPNPSLHPRKRNLVYARESIGGQPFTVRNTQVNPAINMPVVLGYTESSPAVEQVLAVYHEAFPAGTSDDLSGLGPHAAQHEWDGGDVVFIDSRQFKWGMVKPTAPPSMQVVILSFVYLHDSEWKHFEQETSIDFTDQLPSAGTRYALISIDAASKVVRYRYGITAGAQQTWDALLGAGGADDYIPACPGGEIPLAVLELTSTTTAFSWDSSVNNIRDYRLHIGKSESDLRDRIVALEGYVGSDYALPATGAQANPIGYSEQVVDGGYF